MPVYSGPGSPAIFASQTGDGEITVTSPADANAVAEATFSFGALLTVTDLASASGEAEATFQFDGIIEVTSFADASGEAEATLVTEAFITVTDLASASGEAEATFSFGATISPADPADAMAFALIMAMGGPQITGPPPPSGGPRRLIVVTAPDANGNGGGEIIQFAPGKRKRLRFTKVVNGGDDECTWSMDCEDLPETLPGWRSRVEVRNNAGKVVWLGTMEEPEFHFKKGKLVSVDFRALGYSHTMGLQKFHDRVVYGPSSVGATSLQKIVVASISEVVAHALTQLCPLIQGYRIADIGIPLFEDTESFQFKTALDVINSMTGFTYYLQTPVFWQVKPDDYGRPFFDWFTIPGVPEYFDQGKAETVDLSYKASDVTNRVVLGWGNGQTFVYPDINTAIDYSGVPVLQEHAANLQTEIHSLFELGIFAQGLYGRFNRMRATSGAIRITDTLYGQGNVPVDPWEVRPGKQIRLTLQATPPYAANDPMVMRTEFDDEACATILSLQAVDEIGRQARLLPWAPTKGLSWTVLFPTYNPPYPEIWKLPTIGSQTPAAPRGTDPQLGAVIVTAARSDSNNDFGPAGGQIHPEELPINRADIAAILTDVTEGRDRASTSAQPCICDARRGFIEIKTKENDDGTRETGSITVSIDKYSPPPLDTYEHNFLTISLSGQASGYASKTVVNKIIKEEDWLIYNVTSPATGDISRVTVMIHGHKRWPQFPALTQPEWVARPSP